MGYTIHWFRPREFDRERFREWRDDVETIVRHGGVQIRAWDGKGEPGYSEDEVSFNGAADRGEDCETFYVARVEEPPEWAKTRVTTTDGTVMWESLTPDPHDLQGFCKTNRLPYDTVVAACVLALRWWFPETVCIASDDGPEGFMAGIGLLHAAKLSNRIPHVEGIVADALDCRHD